MAINRWASEPVPFVGADQFVHHLSGYPISESQIPGVEPLFQRFQQLWFKVEETLRDSPTVPAYRGDFPWSVDAARRRRKTRKSHLQRRPSQTRASRSVDLTLSRVRNAEDQLKLIFVLYTLAKGWEICAKILSDDQYVSLPISLLELRDFHFSDDWSKAHYGALEFTDLTFLVRLENDKRNIRMAPPPVLNKKNLLATLKKLDIPFRDDARRSAAFNLYVFERLEPFPERVEPLLVHPYYRQQQDTFRHRRGPRSDERRVLETFCMCCEYLPATTKTEVADLLFNAINAFGPAVGTETIIKHLDAADIWKAIPGWIETH